MAGKELSGYPVPNADYPHSVRILVPIAPQYTQLPDLEVLDDFVATVKAWPGNPAGANYIYVAESPAACINPDLSWPLVANEARDFRIKTTFNLYASATAALMWVIVSVERRRT